MKILFVLPYYSLPIPAVKGGAVETLLTILLEENEKKALFEFVFIAPSDTYSKTYYSHSVVYLLDRNNNNYNYDSNAAKIADAEKADFVIMEGAALRLDGCFRNIISKEKLAIHIHSEFERKGIYLDSFGVSISPSNFIAERWNGKNSCNTSETFVLYNAIDQQLFERKINRQEFLECREKMGFDEKDFVVLYCGRLIKEKGVKELVESILLLKNEKIKLLIIGSDSFANGNQGDYASSLLKMVENSNIVTYLGYIPNNELYKWYQSCDIQAVPSLWEEAFGLVAVEGMYSGLPIIYTDSGALPEIIPPNAGEVIFRRGNIKKQICDKILYLKNNPSIVGKMAEVGKKEAVKYTSQDYYKRFVEMVKWWMDRDCED